jgi:hypothetical protein
MDLIRRDVVMRKQRIFRAVFHLREFPTCIIELVLIYLQVEYCDRFRFVLRHEFLSSGGRWKGGYLKNQGGFEVIPNLFSVTVHDSGVHAKFTGNTRLLCNPDESENCCCGMVAHYVELQFRVNKRWKSVFACESLDLENDHEQHGDTLCYQTWQMAEGGWDRPSLSELGILEWHVTDGQVVQLSLFLDSRVIGEEIWARSTSKFSCRR